jgi:hypothetical protein
LTDVNPSDEISCSVSAIFKQEASTHAFDTTKLQQAATVLSNFFRYHYFLEATTATTMMMISRTCRFALLSALVILGLVQSFQPTLMTSRRGATISLHVLATKNEDSKEEPTVEETTVKYGLEVGLAQAVQEEDGGESAKSLLKKYGIAYLATSIPLAIVSFTICYVLVDSGVDVGALLANVGIETSDAADKAGTFAIAYAAHKAASPIRFPPTVLLTPLVAKLIGKEPEVGSTEEEGI